MWGDQQEVDSASTVAAALDAGINLMDTAEAYGDGASEEVLGRALRGRRHEAVIATKICGGNLSGQSIEVACERSLRRLQTDYIDLFQPHWPDHKTSPEESMQALVRLKEAGKIRAIGLSNYGVGDLSAILPHGKAVTNQLPYSLLWRAIEYEIQPRCVQEGIGILCYSVLLHGLLSGKFASPADVPDGRARTRHFSSKRAQTRHGEGGCETEAFAALEQIRQIAAEIGQPMALVSIAWALEQTGVTAVITGARSPGQISELAAATDFKLEHEAIQRLNAATDQVKQILGTNPDMWMSESRFR
jgi:aryl-alcohol dehydrogenase-like predicted oxidoreductase